MLKGLISGVVAAVALLAGAGPALAGTDTIDRIGGGPGSIAAPQPALQIGLQLPEGIAPLPDGGYLLADKHNNRVLRVRPDGMAVVAAGGGSDSSSNNIPATSAYVEYPTDVAVTPDGGFLYVENRRNRVRKVTPDGKVRTVAGNGQLTTDGDNGRATAAGLYYPWSVAVMPGGGFVVSQPYSYRVRRVMPDGTIRTILGDGVDHYPDNVPGTQSGTKWPYGLAVMKDGSVLVAEDFGARVRRVRPDGIVVPFAGSGTDMPAGISQGSENGKPATQVGLGRLCDVAVAPDGSVIIAQSDCAEPPYTAWDRYYLLGRVTPDGKYSVYGGNGFGPTYDVQGKHRLATSFGRVRSLAFAPGGDLLFVENSYYRAYRIDTDVKAPVARLAVRSNPVVAGRPARLDGSLSTAEAPARYAWDLDGNGSYETDSGTTSAIDHTFAAAGSATIGLRVTAAGGAESTRRVTVAVDAAPVPAFKVTPAKPVHGQAATLDASASSDPDGKIVRYEWDIDPAVPGYEVDAGANALKSYTFASAGQRTVRLRVTDDRGAKSTRGMIVSVL
jgi:hypothetical protein